MRQVVGDNREASHTDRLPRRPGDRYEIWPAPAGATELCDAAAQRRLTFSTVVGLVAERSLALEELALDGVDLDAVASGVRLERSMWSASAGYLRYLLHGLDDRAEAAEPSAGVRLPARLADRLRHRWPMQLEAGDLSAAIAWEVAAVSGGWTMTEWALRTALDRPSS